LLARRLALVTRRETERAADHFVALVRVGRLEVLHRHPARELRRLLLDAEHAVPDVNAVARPDVPVILAVDRDAEAVHAGETSVRAAGPVVRPRKARVRDETAEARPARVLLIAIERIQIAHAVREDG